MWTFLIERSDYGRTLRAALVKEEGGGTESAAQPFVMAPVGPGVVLPSIIDTGEQQGREILQAIVDGCWKADIRPTGHDDFRRVNDAQGKHLADMRALVRKLAEVPLP